MTTNGDMSPRRPDEHDPLEHVPDDALDRIDETVAKITDAEVEEHLRRVLDESGYSDSASARWRDLNPDHTSAAVDFDLYASIDDDACADSTSRTAAEFFTAARLEAKLSHERAQQTLASARQQAEQILAAAREEADAALEQAAAMVRDAREQAERIVTDAQFMAERIITASRNQPPQQAVSLDVARGSMETSPPLLTSCCFAAIPAVQRTPITSYVMESDADEMIAALNKAREHSEEPYRRLLPHLEDETATIRSELVVLFTACHHGSGAQSIFCSAVNPGDVGETSHILEDGSRPRALTLWERLLDCMQSADHDTIELEAGLHGSAEWAASKVSLLSPAEVTVVGAGSDLAPPAPKTDDRWTAAGGSGTSRRQGGGMDPAKYAELAVRLVNTASYSEDRNDRLVTMEDLQALVADREHLSSGGSRRDLEALRGLRAEFRKVFAACAAGDGEEVAARLNSLLIRHPVHPQLSGHDNQVWHVHLADSGTVADKYAAGAAMGLAVRLTELGIERFGVCQAAPCQGVFIDTSTNRSRVYCSERCTNRANVTAFRTRQCDIPASATTE